MNKGHEYLCYDDEIELEPDIVITKNDKTVLIIDTKYKILDDDNKVARQDISQILAYCHAYNIKIGLLLYPKFGDRIDHSYCIKNSNIEVRVETIDISCKNRNEFFHNFDVYMNSMIGLVTEGEEGPDENRASSSPVEDIPEDFDMMNRGQDVITESEKVKKLESRLNELESERTILRQEIDVLKNDLKVLKAKSAPELLKELRKKFYNEQGLVDSKRSQNRQIIYNSFLFCILGIFLKQL